MHEIIVHEGPRTEAVDSPIPKPGSNQIIIKVEVAGCNPKDYKTYWFPEPLNQGNDVAGVVHEVGSNVVDFKKGDAVFALHELGTKHGTHAEYCMTWAYTTAHLPHGTKMEGKAPQACIIPLTSSVNYVNADSKSVPKEAATIPLAATSAALGLYRGLQLPQPWQPNPTAPCPVLIYGASSAVGAFAVKLAILSDIHPIIAISGPSGHSLLKGLLDTSKGDILLNYIDYAGNVAGLLAEIKKATEASKQPLYGAFDAISEQRSPEIVLAAIAALSGPKVRLATTLPYPEDKLKQSDRAAKVDPYLVVAADVHNGRDSKAGGQDFGCVMFRMFGQWLQEGRFTGHPFEVRKGGLAGVQTALEALRDGKVRGKELLIDLKDT